MAYNKTTWVNNTTPINDTNLNKIEQGIYDNSLVVDAVTNTLNPTDTETYKTAELTEGQITDVIGVSDIVIKGQTEQDGTPTPSAPVDVNVVSGSNVVNTSNKNLANMTKLFGNSSYYSINHGQLSVTANDGRTWDDLGNDWGIELLAGTYMLSTSKGTTTQVQIQGKNSGQITREAMTNGTKSFTLQQDDIIGIKFLSISTYPKEIGTVQIEQGSTATTYEPHQGKELPLDLGSIELCKIGDYQDYFYKSGSKWYLHKEVEKVILDGSESWNRSSNGAFYPANNLLLNIILPSNSSSLPLLLSNKFIASIYTDVWDNNKDFGIALASNGSNNPRIRNNAIDNVNDFKTWLANNLPSIYCAKSIPTDTEITDTTLISQLEAIYNTPLYEETNITQTNNDLPMVLDITACKDNINGIKAFIRK